VQILNFISIFAVKGENMEAYKGYRSSELRYEDLYNFTSYAKQEGIIEGEEKGEWKSKFQISKNLLEMGMSISDIAKATGLTPKQIQQIN
jgi:predicted transposase/invertase (TIGR01784 family)